MPETVLITGCSSGIGRATARAFLTDDWTVYATARDPDSLADLEEAGAVTAKLDVMGPLRDNLEQEEKTLRKLRGLDGDSNLESIWKRLTGS